MEKFKKIDREFCLTDSSVNCYGFRLLTEGMLLDKFKQNPIGFLMHDREGGVVVKWEDFRIEGDKVFGKPVINLSHPKGEDLAAQVEGGFINAVSVGKIICLEASDATDLKLKQQKGPTITKWYPREISFVDIPGNYNALANLYDIEDNEINYADLGDFVKTKNPKSMNKTMLSATLLASLNLKDSSNEFEFNQAIQDLVDKASKVPQLEKDLADKTTELQDLKAETIKKEVADLCDKGIADKKLTTALAENLKSNFEGKPKELKSLIDAMPVQVSVVQTLVDMSQVPNELADKSWDDLYQLDQLEMVQKKYPNLYEKLKNEKFKK